MKTQCVLLFLIIAAIDAFTIQPTAARMTVSHRTMNHVQFMSQDAQAEAEALREKARQLKEEAAALSGTTVEAMEASEPKKEKVEEVAVAKLNADGTFYDDEVAEYKDPLSDNMRARLMKEASTGLDADKKQTNVLLYIMAVVGVLVIAGGSGILY